MSVMNRYYFLLLSLLSYGLRANAQTNDPDYDTVSIQGRPFSQYLSEQFREKRFQLDSFGSKGNCWVKFKIDTLGTPTAIVVSSGTTIRISKFLQQQIKNTKGAWPIKRTKGQPVESDYLILPVRYVFYTQDSTAIKLIETSFYSLADFFHLYRQKAERITMLSSVWLHSGIE